MKNKFITIDGYSELKYDRKPTKKSVLKTIKKFFKVSFTAAAQSLEEYKENKELAVRLENCYRAQRKSGSESIRRSAQAVTKASKKAVVYVKRTTKASTNFLRQKAVLGAVTSFVAVALCVLTATSGLSLSAFAMEDIVFTEPAVKVESGDISVSDTDFSKTVHTNISQSMSDSKVLTSGYGLYIDKKLVGVSVDKESLEKALKTNLDEYKAKYDDETTDKYANSVEIVAGSYDSADFDDAEKIVENNKEKFSYSLSTDIIYNQKVPYTTRIKYSSSKLTSYRKTIRKGVNGKQRITYRVTFVDGVQTAADVADVKTLREAKEAVVVVGTKKTVRTTSYSPATRSVTSYSAPATGRFMWPVPYTRNITSGYGYRWGSFHSGIDIAAGGCYGKAIVASDSGTVTWAGYDSSGYGNYVIINHGNGYSTLYGHCSSLYVSRGQHVGKGQTIAAIGSTGYSTGPHLHFEVRSGGSRLNPNNFV